MSIERSKRRYSITVVDQGRRSERWTNLAGLGQSRKRDDREGSTGLPCSRPMWAMRASADHGLEASCWVGLLADARQEAELAKHAGVWCSSMPRPGHRIGVAESCSDGHTVASELLDDWQASAGCSCRIHTWARLILSKKGWRKGDQTFEDRGSARDRDWTFEITMNASHPRDNALLLHSGRLYEERFSRYYTQHHFVTRKVVFDNALILQGYWQFRRYLA